MSDHLKRSIDGVDRLSEYDDHEVVLFLHDKTSGLRAFIAIHSTTLGPAQGGTRMMQYNNDEDALRDVLLLSKAMSYKCAVAGLPYGGAKGVIVWNGNETDRQAVLRAYADKLEQLNGLFKTGTDVGLSDEDVEIMAQRSHFLLGLSKENKHNLTISKTAALGVYLSIKTALKYKHHDDNLASKTISIKGIGKLGYALAELLLADGASIIVADLDSIKVASLKSTYPGRVTEVSSEEIHKQSTDLYAPCAFGNEFTPDVINELGSKIIVGGANNQLPNDQAGYALLNGGVLYAPDYIVNAGGLVFASEDLEADSFNLTRVNRRLDHIIHELNEVFKAAENKNLPTQIIANQIAQQRLEKMQS